MSMAPSPRPPVVRRGGEVQAICRGTYHGLCADFPGDSSGTVLRPAADGCIDKEITQGAHHSARDPAEGYEGIPAGEPGLHWRWFGALSHHRALSTNRISRIRVRYSQETVAALATT